MTDLFVTPKADSLDYPELKDTKYTPQDAAVYLAVLSTGATPLKTAASRIGVDVKTVRSWRAVCPGFDNMVKAVLAAREIGYNAVLHDIATNDGHRDQSATTRWLLEKSNPGTFAPRQKLEVTTMSQEEQHEALVDRFTDPGDAVLKALTEAGWKR